MLKDLIGNDNVKQTLKRLVTAGRVPNSLLFAGDDGVGKRRFAIELAKAFICAEPADGEACGVCPPCRRADVFVFPKSEKKDDFKQVFFSEHPDVGTVIPFNRNILVDAVRDLEREASFRPYESATRFFIVDDADKMNDAAANALLKTLEEPPSTSYIFLVTARPDALLPTIRSRCQTVRFAPISAPEIEEFLVKDRAFTRDEARLAARFARGSISRAMSVNASEFRTAREKLIGVIESAILGRDRASMMKVSEELNDAKHKENFEENLDVLESLIHDIWSLATAGDTSRIINADIIEQLRSLAENSKPARLTNWLAEIESMRMNFIVNINRRVATDALFTKMAAV